MIVTIIISLANSWAGAAKGSNYVSMKLLLTARVSVS